MLYKNCECKLVFHQKPEETKSNLIKVCIHPDQTSWGLREASSFLREVKIKSQRLSAPYVFIRIPERDKRMLKDIIQEYLDLSKDIYSATHTDPKRIGSLQDTAVYYFEQTLKHHHFKLPKATIMESNWLHQSHRGGIMHAVPGNYAQVYKYDFTSYYPSLCNSPALFPTACPTKRFLNDFLDLNIPAIYRVKVLNTHPLLRLRPIDKFNQSFLYCTNLDIQTAHELKVQIELCEKDEKWANCLEYQVAHTVPGHRLFGRYVDKFFKLKQTGSKAGKMMLNVLTGKLVAKERTYLRDYRESQQPIDITKYNIQSMTDTLVTFFSPGKHIFKRPDLARLGVFITAHGRHHIIKYLKDQNALENIVQIHTDGFVLTKPLSKNLVQPSVLGGLKLEHCGQMEVVHVNKCITEAHSDTGT